ncbi:MAG: energy transducer TonB, partial [Bacteroidetes bacterium]
FIVDKNGKIKNISVVRGTECMDINMEAIRVVSESPVWEPGMQKNSKTNVSFTIPISFHLK